MKLKHFVLVLLAVFSLSIISCGSDEIKQKLNGTWVSDSEKDNDGSSAIYSFSFDTNAMTGTYTVTFSVEEYKDFAIVKVPFTWSLTSDTTISFIMKTDDVGVAFSKEFERDAQAENFDLASLAADYRSEVNKAIGTLSGVEISNLSDNSVTFNADGNLTTYHRQ